jgi:hypothetical protein
MHFNVNAAGPLKQNRAKRVYLLWDSQSRKVAVQATDDRGGQRVYYGNSEARVYVTRFLNWAGVRMFKHCYLDATWNEKMHAFEVIIPEKT